MGQAEPRSPSLLSPRADPFVKGVANSTVKTEANKTLSGQNNHLSGHNEPPLPITPERLELIKACAKGRSNSADEAATSRIAKRFAPRAPVLPPSGDAKRGSFAPLTSPLVALTSGIRNLTAVLIVAALIPNLTLALFWLGLVDPPWSEVAAPAPKESSRTPAETAALPPVLSAPNVLDVSQGETVIFPIALDGTDGVPDRSLIVIRGLPPGSTMSDGYSSGATEWRLKPDEIGDLRLALAPTARGESTLLVQLRAPDASIIATTSTTLRTRSEPSADPGPYEITDAPQGLNIASAERLADEPEANVEERMEITNTASIELNTAPIETVPLPDRRPQPVPPPGAANWIRPTAWVNLRENPSPTAPVVTIVAKGSKLRVIARKRSWVQVSNPATSQSGWIYAGNLASAR